MSFSLYHIPSGNMLGDFDDEAAAYQAVLDEVETNDDATELGLEEYDERGNHRVVAIGRDLEELAAERTRASVSETAGAISFRW